MQQFGVIGLSVMGKNLALNVKNHGYSVSGFSIDKPEVDALAKYEDKNLKPTYTWEEFVNSLEKPRKILIQIMAGKPVDETLQKLLPLLDKGDILIDGGNSNFHDTNLHNTIFNTVVNHLHIVTTTCWSNVSDTWLTSWSLGSHSFKDWSN